MGWNIPYMQANNTPVKWQIVIFTLWFLYKLNKHSNIYTYYLERLRDADTAKLTIYWL